MSDKISLTEDELTSLFNGGSSNNESETSRAEFSLLSELMSASVSKVKGSLSSKFGEEVECTVSAPEIINGLQAPVEGEFYVVNSSFTNNGSSIHYFIYPSEVGFNLAKSSSGLEDFSNSLDEVRPYLFELTELVLNDMATQFERGFSAQLDDVIQTNNINEINPNSRFIRFSWNMGNVEFYQFFHISILSLLQEEGKAETEDIELDIASLGLDSPKEESGIDDSSAVVASLLDSNADSDVSPAHSSFIGGFSGEKSDSVVSLGEELLKESQSVSNVSLPNLSDTQEKTSIPKHEMDMLYGVSMELTVELGNSRMRIEEILELNRGSIIELRKLAGEPLDIKVNNKLIAKGEVVVIDENFGVRVIEIISSQDRMKEMQ